jgi:hypothetical protein
MSEQLDTKTRESTGTGDAWPPVAHIARKPVVEDGYAICGAKLMGIELQDATKMCKKCIEIAKRLNQ